MMESIFARMFILFLAGVMFSGCATFSSRSTGTSQKHAPAPVVRLIDSNPGRVAMANPKFVVLIFPFGKVPGVGQRLNVYHDGKKVGELKIAGPQRDNNTVADIVFGTAQIDDEVRAD
jgi:hypothetical protein